MIITIADIERVGTFSVTSTDEDLYSYLALALLGLSLLKRERQLAKIRSLNRGLYYHFLETVKRLVRGRLANNHTHPLRRYVTRLMLGTIYWGKMSLIPIALTSSPYWHRSLGGLLEILKIWPSKIQKKTNR